MAKPATGAILGLIAGVFLAIFIQQTGAWPLDRLLLFGVAGLMALIGLLLCTVGRTVDNVVILIIAIIIVLVPIGYGASQLVSGDDTAGAAYIDGCTLMASSDLESLQSITAMTRTDPFDIDPDGMLHWEGTSNAAIMNYQWEVFVDVGGFNLRVANGMDPNTDGDQDNDGDEGLKQYSDQVRRYGGGEIRGIYYVSGNLIGEGGRCDGAGYVRVPGSVFESTLGIVVGIIFLILLIILIIVCMRGRSPRVREVSRDERRIDALPDDLGDLGDSGTAK